MILLSQPVATVVLSMVLLGESPSADAARRGRARGRRDRASRRSPVGRLRDSLTRAARRPELRPSTSVAAAWPYGARAGPSSGPSSGSSAIIAPHSWTWPPAGSDGPVVWRQVGRGVVAIVRRAGVAEGDEPLRRRRPRRDRPGSTRRHPSGWRPPAARPGPRAAGAPASRAPRRTSASGGRRPTVRGPRSATSPSRPDPRHPRRPDERAARLADLGESDLDAADHLAGRARPRPGAGSARVTGDAGEGGGDRARRDRGRRRRSGPPRRTRRRRRSAGPTACRRRRRAPTRGWRRG